MAGVATIALIERKPGITRSLFTRYWRDVHGVMAARIPGFQSYEQNHVLALPVSGRADAEPFEGIAICHFAQEADRDGLTNSAVTGHIHRDEQNVFRRALLYSLDTAAYREHRQGAARFRVLVVVPKDDNMEAMIDHFKASQATSLSSYDLTSGNPERWNATDVNDSGSGRHFTGLLDCGFETVETGVTSIEALRTLLGKPVAAYEVEQSYRMVDEGVPTPVGLRGFAAVQTIADAQADNQLDTDVTRAVYGLPA